MLLARFAICDEIDVTDASRWTGDAGGTDGSPSRALSTGGVLDTGGGMGEAAGVPGRRGVVGSGATGLVGTDDVGRGASGGRGGGVTEGECRVGCRAGGRA